MVVLDVLHHNDQHWHQHMQYNAILVVVVVVVGELVVVDILMDRYCWVGYMDNQLPRDDVVEFGFELWSKLGWGESWVKEFTGVVITLW